MVPKKFQQKFHFKVQPFRTYPRSFLSFLLIFSSSFIKSIKIWQEGLICYKLEFPLEFPVLTTPSFSENWNKPFNLSNMKRFCFVFFTVSFSHEVWHFSYFLQISKLHLDNKKRLFFSVKDPAFPQSSTLYAPTVQQHSPDRKHDIWWRPWTVLWKTAVNLFQLLFFLHLMNEISHAALLRALAHLGGRALSLYLSLMPSNTLLPFVNYWHTFWEQTHH